MTVSASSEPVLVGKGLHVRRAGSSLLDDVDIEVRRGDVVALTGRNGAGKTTLLRVLVGEIRPERGEVRRSGRIGYVPQKLLFDPSSCATVLDLFVATLSRCPLWLGATGRVRELSAAALARVGADPLLERPFGRLSGGERQRVLFALAMTPQPDILLLDEPEAGVDAEGLDLLRHVVGGGDCPHCHMGVVLATHDPETVERLATSRIHLERGSVVVSR